MIAELPTIDDIARGTPVSQVVLSRCVEAASLKHRLDPKLFMSILDSENGLKGTIKVNSDGSFDLGPAQLNTVHLNEPWYKKSYRGVTWMSLANDVCLNVDVAGRHFRNKIDELKPGQSIWNAVGHYHSKTGRYKIAYLQRVMKLHRKRAEGAGGGFSINL